MLKSILTCDVCGKEEIFSGPKAIRKARATWNLVPDKEKGFETEWDRSDYYMHEWLCSDECVSKWVDLDPMNRVIFEEEEDDGLIFIIPMHIVRRTKDHIWLCCHDLLFRISNGDWEGGGLHGRCYGRLRKKDRLRLMEAQNGPKCSS